MLGTAMTWNESSRSNPENKQTQKMVLSYLHLRYLKKSLLGSTVELFRVLFPSTGFGTSWFRFHPKTSRAAHSKTMHLKDPFSQVPTMDFVTFERLYLGAFFL